MKGKKVDQEFVSQFIIKCAKKEINTPELIVEYAKQMISNIDHQIIELEKQKIKRGKLLDVISTFEKKEKLIDDPEKDKISFFQIKNIKVCQFICQKIKIQPCTMVQLESKDYSKLDIIFSIKQLIQHQVIAKTQEILVKGKKFEEYLQFVFQEEIK